MNPWYVVGIMVVVIYIQTVSIVMYVRYSRNEIKNQQKDVAMWRDRYFELSRTNKYYKNLSKDRIVL